MKSIHFIFPNLNHLIMKHLLLPLLLGLMFSACVEDSISPTYPNTNASIDQRSPQSKVAVCHFSEEYGTWHMIMVSLNALPAHLAHGDAVDMDGDGYFNLENGCAATDCDDSDPDITTYAEIPCDGIDNDCDGYIDENTNLAIGATASATSDWAGHIPAFAIDGDPATGWNSGYHPIQYITIDLGAEHPISALCLTVDQSPDGYTKHLISFSTDGIDWPIVDNIYSVTSAHQVLTRTYTDESARYIRVTTIDSPSWVAWYEIAVY